jgi:hypothetical protein
VLLRPDKRIQAWRPLICGQRVMIVGKWKHRQHGTILERLDNDISGMGRYSVRIDCLPYPADCCRHELKAFTVQAGRNRKRAMDDSLSPNAEASHPTRDR